MNYKILKHTADLKIKIWGNDMPTLFKNAAHAMFDVMCGKKPKTSNQKIAKTKKIEISAYDYESLLINFLNELLFLTDVNNERFEINDLKIENKKRLTLNANLVPYPLSSLEIEIKGATYHDLQIKKDNSIYAATIVFDV